MRSEFQKWYELLAKIEEVGAEYLRWLDLIDKEEASNGDTETLDIMIHNMNWFLADAMVKILDEAAQLEGRPLL